MAENYYENCWFFICRLQITMYGSEWSLVLFRMKLGFVQNEAWFCSKWSLVLFKMKLGFAQNEASFLFEWSFIFIREKLRTRGRLVMNSRQACHGLVESFLRSRTMNILIGGGLTFSKTKSCTWFSGTLIRFFSVFIFYRTIIRYKWIFRIESP